MPYLFPVVENNLNILPLLREVTFLPDCAYLYPPPSFLSIFHNGNISMATGRHGTIPLGVPVLFVHWCHHRHSTPSESRINGTCTWFPAFAYVGRVEAFASSYIIVSLVELFTKGHVKWKIYIYLSFLKVCCIYLLTICHMCTNTVTGFQVFIEHIH